ncbi:bifunctional diaminohydroxyphosphoribosylaminopyrimidine deaminase/5-amino-6-(5-phosphoribosylamino)uracil reductase RibD, partial [Aduncisulcus paluster]
RPYACAKWAMTIDGKMATDSGSSAYISSEMSRRQVHKWRCECDAVVIGKGTAKLDNPRLDVRMVEGRNPYRVVIDTLAEIQLDSHLVQCEDAHKTIVLTTPLSKESKRKDLLSAGVE